MNKDLPDKLPPQNNEAEQSLLGCLMLDKDAIIKIIDYIKAEDFYKGIHQDIFQAMAELYERSEPIDILSVSSRLKERNKLEDIGGSAYLTSLINTVPTATHVSNYAKIVRQKKILRDLISASEEIGLSAFDETEEIDVLLDRAEKTVFSIGQRSLTQTFLPIKDVLSDTFERLDELSKYQGKLRGVPTGFTDLDKILGGLQTSDLVVLAARPSMGKTSLALDIARNIAVRENKPVGVFSLEMSKDQLADRLLASLANINLWNLRNGRLTSDDYSRLQHAMGSLSEAPLYIDDAGSVNILQIRAMARRLQANKGLSLIVIDYLQLMEPMNKFQSPVQQVTKGDKGVLVVLGVFVALAFVPMLFPSLFANSKQVCAKPTIQTMNDVAITDQSVLREMCIGGSTTIYVDATGARGYQWNKGGADIPGATGSALKLSDVSLATRGKYVCVVTGRHDKVVSADIIIRVYGAH